MMEVDMGLLSRLRGVRAHPAVPKPRSHTYAPNLDRMAVCATCGKAIRRIVEPGDRLTAATGIIHAPAHRWVHE